MTLQSVRAFLAEHAPNLEIIEKSTSTATAAQAAEAHAVVVGQIAKTLSLKLREGEPILIVLAGDAKMDNRKFKDRFGEKPVMLAADDAVRWTGHPVGGVCPFGLAHPLRIFVDRSLRRFDVVLPAAGATNTALRITPDRLAKIVGAEWVDVAQVASA